MVDFSKKLGSKSVEKKLNPVEIYDKLDRRTETGDLRPVQEEILTKWWSNRKNNRDLILKLHTGQGKTLIGLLILQSRLNEKKGPCLYVCPNIYLVKQTCQEAEKFGIGYVTLDNQNFLPDEFLNSEKILIVHIQKLFNGKSTFGIGGRFTKVNTIILDDSHGCIDYINESFKIKIEKGHEIYEKLFNLFKEDLRGQGEGSFFEIQNGLYNTFLPVPYWSWLDKKSEVTQILLQYTDDNKIKFTWDLIKDNIENCQCFFSGQKLEISNYLCPIDKFGTFSKADYRILMSATTQNDSFFIKGLGLNAKAVKEPLSPVNEKWSGEKMILIPSLINDTLQRTEIIYRFIKPNPNRQVGVVAITPSDKKSFMYKDAGGIVTYSNNIFESLSFGQPSDKFEKALQDLGLALGFLSQRPDREFKKGPDNIWCAESEQYFMFECKSEVEDSRKEISKTETGQMNNHCGWFEQEYSTQKVKRVLVIPVKNVSSQANFTHEVEIMRREKLQDLKNNVFSFFKELKDYKINDISDQKLQEWLLFHKLDVASLVRKYTEKYFQKKS